MLFMVYCCIAYPYIVGLVKLSRILRLGREISYGVGIWIKVVIVACNKCCRSYKEGGLGIVLLSILNEASNLHLCGTTFQDKKCWVSM